MLALSIRQPWAFLICAGSKDIANRNRRTDFRGRIYVHAAKRFDDAALEWLWNKGFNVMEALLLSSPRIAVRGAIVGEVDIVDCVTESKSVWFTGEYGFVLANPVVYKKPIICKGKPGFFSPEIGAAR